MKTVPCTWDVLVALRKTGGKNGDSARNGVPIGRCVRGFLSQENLDPVSGLPKLGERMEISDQGFSSSEVESVTQDESDQMLYHVKTQTGFYQMRLLRHRKLRRNI